MATADVESPPINNIAELVHRLGDISLERIRVRPALGTATVEDVTRIQEHEGKLCELIDGVLVEKVMGYSESNIASLILEMLNSFVRKSNLGLVTGEAGTMELLPALVPIPDVAFVSWDRFPEHRRPKAAVPRVAPNLAVEVLSKGNTTSEMAAKRRDYFASGVELVWEIDPQTRTAVVYTSPNDCETLTASDTLDGGT